MDAPATSGRSIDCRTLSHIVYQKRGYNLKCVSIVTDAMNSRPKRVRQSGSRAVVGRRWSCRGSNRGDQGCWFHAAAGGVRISGDVPLLRRARCHRTGGAAVRGRRRVGPGRYHPALRAAPRAGPSSDVAVHWCDRAGADDHRRATKGLDGSDPALDRLGRRLAGGGHLRRDAVGRPQVSGFRWQGCVAPRARDRVAPGGRPAPSTLYRLASAPLRGRLSTGLRDHAGAGVGAVRRRDRITAQSGRRPLCVGVGPRRLLPRAAAHRLLHRRSAGGGPSF